MLTVDILEAKKVAFELKDVSADEEAKEFMKQTSGKALVPQIFIDNRFKGGYEEFRNAVEEERLNEFFELSGVF